MKSQFIEVKTVIEVMTDEEISYTEAERLARNEIDSALYQRYNNIIEKTEHMAPPYFRYEIIP